MKTMYLYGIAGADQVYRVVNYQFLTEEDISVTNMVYTASMMKIRYPNIERVYAMDNRHGLRRDYTVASKKNSIESWAIFKDILEREGLKMPIE